MNFEQMSDFEINQQVGNVSGLATVSEPVLKQVIRNSNGKEFDPCNSWSDAGPIIGKENISLIFGFGHWDAMSPSGESLQAEEVNPLRAAMIVFLIMQEGKCSN